MIPASGLSPLHCKATNSTWRAGGPEFNSRSSPFLFYCISFPCNTHAPERTPVGDPPWAVRDDLRLETGAGDRGFHPIGCKATWVATDDSSLSHHRGPPSYWVRRRQAKHVPPISNSLLRTLSNVFAAVRCHPLAGVPTVAAFSSGPVRRT